MPMSTFRLTILCLLLVSGASGALDLSSPEEVLEACVRADGGTAGKDRTAYGTTTVYAFVPGAQARPLLRLEVVGATRYEPVHLDRVQAGDRRAARARGRPGPS